MVDELKQTQSKNQRKDNKNKIEIDVDMINDLVKECSKNLQSVKDVSGKLSDQELEFVKTIVLGKKDRKEDNTLDKANEELVASDKMSASLLEDCYFYKEENCRLADELDQVEKMLASAQRENVALRKEVRDLETSYESSLAVRKADAIKQQELRKNNNELSKKLLILSLCSVAGFLSLYFLRKK